MKISIFSARKKEKMMQGGSLKTWMLEKMRDKRGRKSKKKSLRDRPGDHRKMLRRSRGTFLDQNWTKTNRSKQNKKK